MGKRELKYGKIRASVDQEHKVIYQTYLIYITELNS